MMQNRYDRGHDPDPHYARRDERDHRDGNYNRDEDDWRYGERDPWRSGERDPWRSGESSFRPNPRQNWSNREGPWQNQAGRWQNASGRFRDRPRDEYERSSWEREGQRSSGQRYPDVRGYYQEQRWARDPSTGNVYGIEYSIPIGQRYGEREYAARGGRYGEWEGEGRGGRSGPWNKDRGAYGSQYGKGPKGYVRSDERIREDVCDRLSDDDEVDASEISVSVKEGEVTLEGTVTDRHSKHRAEDIAESVSGVRDVTNRLRTKKSFMRELGDKLSGEDEVEHRGHTGSGTRNSPAGVGNRGAQSH